MKNEFTYKDLCFKPLKTLKGKASDFQAISQRITNTNITPDGWNYNEFYKVAEENGFGDIDLFEVNGKVVIAATNYLFQYK